MSSRAAAALEACPAFDFGCLSELQLSVVVVQLECERRERAHARERVYSVRNVRLSHCVWCNYRATASPNGNASYIRLVAQRGGSAVSAAAGCSRVVTPGHAQRHAHGRLIDIVVRTPYGRVIHLKSTIL
jgi:hypothetical protein